MKSITIAVLMLLVTGLVAGRALAGTPDDNGAAPDQSVVMESTPTPDTPADIGAGQPAGAGSDMQADQSSDTSTSAASPVDASAAASATPSPADLSAGPVQGGAPPIPVPALGGQCAGGGTYFVPGFGCSAGSLPSMPVNPGPSGSCGGNAAPTNYGCTAGYLATTGSPNGNADGSNNCPGISHRTAMGCTPGVP